MPGDDAIVARVRGELSATAFELVELEVGAVDARAALAHVAAAHDAGAALRVRVASSRPAEATRLSVELWSASSDAAAGALDTITVPDGETHAAEVLAVRVVETLRARSLGLVLAQPSAAVAPKPEPGPDAQGTEALKGAQRDAERSADEELEAEVIVPAEPMSSRAPARALWLELAPSFVLSSGGLGPQLSALLALRLDASRLLSISVFGAAPLWRAELAAQEGQANVSTWLLGAAIDAQLRWRASALSAGAGIASVLTHMRGSASPPFEGDAELVTSAAPVLRAALHVQLTAWLRVGARGMLGAALPRVSVRFEEREVARWGQPFALVGICVELALAQP
jgi:hypothetical protein